VPDFDITGAIGLFAPGGTPRPIVMRLNSEINQTSSVGLRSPACSRF
jgi:hypothetical protein